VKTASAATNLFNAAKSGNWSAISASAGALDKVLGGTGTLQYNPGTGNNLDTNPDLNGSQEFYGLEDPNYGADALGLSIGQITGVEGGDQYLGGGTEEVNPTDQRLAAGTQTTPGGVTAAPTTAAPKAAPPATTTTKTPATPQTVAQAAQDGYMPPIVLVKIKKLFEDFGPAAFTGMSIEDLVKSVQSDEAAATESENPIYAAQGGSIDDLIEYLRR